jgi:PST family polysaccharide transporter
MASRSAAWLAAETVVGLLGAVLTTFVVARLIGPGGTGQAALAAAVVMLVQPVCAYAFTNAMVQRRTLSDEDVATVVWASLAIALLAAAGTSAAGVLLLGWGGGGLGPLVVALAAVLPLNAVEGAANGVLLRRQDFRGLALRSIGAHVAGFAAGVSLALASAGAWAVVGQQLAYFLVSAALAASFAPLRPRPVLRWSTLGAMRRFALASAGWGVVQRANFRVFLLVVAADRAPEMAGVLQIAFRITEIARDLPAPVVHRYALPILSRLQDDRAFARRLEAMLFLSGLGFAPLFVGLALTIPELQAILLGPAWAGIVDPVRVVCLALALTIWADPIGMALTAAGQPQLNIHLALAGIGAMAVAGLVVRPEEAAGAAAVWTASVVVPATISVFLAARLLDLPLRRQLAVGILSLLPAGATLGAVLLAEAAGWVPAALLPALLVKVALGGAAGGAAILLMGRRAWQAAMAPLPQEEAQSSPRTRS